MEKGTLIQVKTKTKDDTFGEVVYEIMETGLIAADGGNDGVKAVMIGGNGPSARKGYTVMDTERNIRSDIAKGITKIVPRSRVGAIKGFYNK